jgi:uncharacterized membrane protein YozB (DUF420 family)
MSALLNGPGFFGTTANFRSDATLALVLITAVMLTVGWILALQKRYEAHRWVQTSAVILNTFAVVFTMMGSYLIHILPGIPAKLNQGDYAVTTVHALVGLVGMVLGVFIVLRGNKLVPKALRFKNYKLFMRTSYTLYMLATFLGVIVYLLVYVYGI